MKQKIDYIVQVDILRDWQVDKPSNRVYTSIDNVKHTVDLLLTQREWDIMQNKKWLDKQNWIRNKALDELCRQEYWDIGYEAGLIDNEEEWKI